MIVGGGYIGLEMLDCFKCMGVNTVVVDIAPRVLMKTFDEDMVRIVEEELSEARSDALRFGWGEGIRRGWAGALRGHSSIIGSLRIW